MRLSYSSVLKADTNTHYGSTPNDNYVKLRWARTGGSPDSIMSDAHVHTYGIEITKKFSDGLGNFANVRFTVQNNKDLYYVVAELRDGIYYVTGHTTESTAITHIMAK